ncbi:MAG: hypothetical protein AABY93_13620 [Bacteroidota bacterium]
MTCHFQLPVQNFIPKPSWLIFTIGLFTYLLTFPISTCAQLSQPHRYEILHDNSSNSFNIISLKEQGLALIREKDKYEEGKKLWEIILLDSLLKETWTNDVALEYRYQMIGYEYTPDFVFILFRAGETDSDFLHLIQLNLVSHELIKFEIKHQFNLRLTHFSIAGNHAVLGGYVVREPAVLLYELNTKQVKVVPGFFLTDTELLDLRVNVNNTFNTVLMERGKKEKKNLWVRTFDESGRLILEDEIDIDQDKTVLTAQTSMLKRDEMMVLGTYGKINSKLATGIFSVAIDPFSKQSPHYFDFAQFEHLLDYMSAKRANKIKTKAQRSRETGTMPDFSLHLQPFRIEENAEGFIMISEVYSPNSSMTQYPYWNTYYNQNVYYPYGFNSPTNRYYNSPYSSSNVQSSDYRILETSAMLFNSQGKLVWDHSMKLPDVHIPALEQVGDFIFLGNRSLIVYKREDKIQSKVLIINDRETLEDTVKIVLKNPTDVLRFDSKDEGGIRYWYGSSFYSWGNQSIRNELIDGDKVRNVFYVNKVKAN